MDFRFPGGRPWPGRNGGAAAGTIARTDPMLRQQMAVFLVKTILVALLTPTAGGGDAGRPPRRPFVTAFRCPKIWCSERRMHTSTKVPDPAARSRAPRRRPVARGPARAAPGAGVPLRHEDVPRSGGRAGRPAGHAARDGARRPRLPRRVLDLDLALHDRPELLHQEAAAQQVRPGAERSLDTDAAPEAARLADPAGARTRRSPARRSSRRSSRPSARSSRCTARCCCSGTWRG